MPAPVAHPDSRYFRLFENSKRLFWDPSRIDLSREAADWARIRRDHAHQQFPEQLYRLIALFYQGEASVTRTLAPYLLAASRLELGTDLELYLTSQIYEEAKHFDFFSRYFREVLGEDGAATLAALTPEPQRLLVDGLDALGERLRREDDPERLAATLVEAVAYYMGVVEAMVARTGYVAAHDALASRGWLPGLQEGFRLIRRDEGRHVAFGVHFLADRLRARPADRAIVERVFERELPTVVGIVQSFAAYPEPIVDLDKLTRFALDASRQFLAGIEPEGASDDLLTELEGG